MLRRSVLLEKLCFTMGRKDGFNDRHIVGAWVCWSDQADSCEQICA